MPKVTIITNDDFSGTLFLNYLCQHGVEIEKVYVAAAIRGGIAEKIKKAMNLVTKKSLAFLWYRSFVERSLFKQFALNGRPLMRIDRLTAQKGIEIERVQDVDDEHFVKKFDKFKDSDDLVLSAYGSQIFSGRLIGRIKNFWNVHGSYLPFFRGAAPYFWMLLKDDYPRGVTLHQVIKKLDAGKIIRQKEIEPRQGETLLSYHARCVLAAAQLFVSVFQNEYHQIVENIHSDQHPGRPISHYDGSSVRPIRRFGLPLSCDIEEFRKKRKQFFRWEDFEQIPQMFEGKN